MKQRQREQVQRGCAVGTVVQDAKLIQTGTSGWLADLMLGAGMVLSAAGPHAAASPRRVPQALRGFFCWPHGPFRQKKTGLLHISVGQSCLAARVGARASGVSGRGRLSARFSFPPEPPGCFPGSARASARC